MSGGRPREFPAPLTSLQNPRVKGLRLLQRRGGSDGRRALVEGWRLCAEAAALGLLTSVCFVPERLGEGRLDELAAWTRGGRVEPIPVSERVFREIALTESPQGVAGEVACRWRELSGPADLSGLGASGDPLLLALDRIQDPGNVGALLRTGAALGVAGAIIGPGCADPYGGKALRAAMGATLRLPLLRPAAGLGEALHLLRREGFRLVAAVPRGRVHPEEADWRGRVVLLLGSEGSGLSPEAEAVADLRCAIPLDPGAESLNVAVAGGILLYVAATHRRGAPGS